MRLKKKRKEKKRKRKKNEKKFLSYLVGELEGLDQPQGLVDAAAHGQVVDRHLAEDPGGRDDEEAAEGDAGVVALVCFFFRFFFIFLKVFERRRRVMSFFSLFVVFVPFSASPRDEAKCPGKLSPSSFSSFSFHSLSRALFLLSYRSARRSRSRSTW